MVSDLQEEFWGVGLTSVYDLNNEFSYVTDGLIRDFDQHGPAGPTAFWKVTDDLAEEKNSSMPLAYF